VDVRAIVAAVAEGRMTAGAAAAYLEQAIESGSQQPRQVRVDYPAVSASARPGEMTDEEAAGLWPPATAEEADSRARQIAASRVGDLDDLDLHRLLFGDTTGEAAG
jgi:hypothetical protein